MEERRAAASSPRVTDTAAGSARREFEFEPQRGKIGMRGLIDPPSTACPTKEWESFLVSLENEDPNDRTVQLLRRKAETELADRRRAKKPWWIGGENPA